MYRKELVEKFLGTELVTLGGCRKAIGWAAQIQGLGFLARLESFLQTGRSKAVSVHVYKKRGKYAPSACKLKKK